MLRRITFVGIDRNGRVPFGLYGAEGDGEEETTPPTPPPPATDPPAGTDDQEETTEDDKTYSAAEMKKVREEAARTRVKLRELEKAEADRKKAEMSETDRLKAEKEEADKRAAKLEKDLQRERVNSAITAAATTAKFADPTDAHAFIDVSSITILDDGKPDGRSVKAAVDKLAKDKPHLVTPAGSGDGGASGSGKLPKPAVAVIEQDLKEKGLVPV